MKNKLLATLFGAALVLGACGGGDDNAAPKDDAANDNGAATTDVDAEAVVQQSCASCHGGNLEGGAGPALDKAGATHSEEEIHDIIINGKGAMPPGIIQGEEADAVAAWLAEKK
ncbi:cytochrome C551 [Sporosarcina sp. P12(2017)]|uniref:Cytochrome C551 n=1 Tax=Sporosarcina ureae TaxID=1571 RepID=A0ABM6JYD3_SPOUR|nr:MULTISPECIES: cytochrome c [Sporosarcina]ARF15116.1 cytochrome C551 [Sporosarcina ureae]PIC56169.1 cytochrome C551 [Sporosarcina sp. P10]PIC60059.1 cytochrome C551 [Sporosarcina sp. P12(2017)]